VQLVLLGDFVELFLEGVDGALAGVEVFGELHGIVRVHFVLGEF
jgi:hypothetical protein